MSIFSFHLKKTSALATLKWLINPPDPKRIPGLIHAECMAGMTLGSAIFSPSRILLRQLVVFAQWESEGDIDRFLENEALGKELATGWHIRLSFLRQWGSIDGFVIPETSNDTTDPHATVVAVTLARMKLLQVPRFIRWGRPVEKLVRDHPKKNLALAATRLPRTVSTFSIWKSEQEMVKMVHGHSMVSQPKRHADAMKERDRKDFHIRFTTLRFKPISESGSWEGMTNISNFSQQNH